MMSDDCIFCKIARGAIPSAKVYEDADVIAFMDIAPVAKGHVLVVPKAHHDPIINTPDDVLQKLIVIVKKIAAAQVRALKADGISVSQANGAVAGQIIPHIHFHVIPRHSRCGEAQVWKSGKYDSPEEMADFAGRLRKAVECS